MSFKKKSTCAFATLLLLLAVVCIAGGCGGSSGDGVAKTKQTALIGEVAAADRKTLADEGIELVAYSKENLLASRALMVSGIASMTEEQRAEVKAMFAENKGALITVYQPASADISKMKTLLFGASQEYKAILKEDTLTQNEDGSTDKSAHVRVYSIVKDANGGIHSYAGIWHDMSARFPSECRDDNICIECVSQDHKTGIRYNEAKQCYERVTYGIKPAKTTYISPRRLITEPAYVYEQSIDMLDSLGDITSIDASDSRITACFGLTSFDCIALHTRDKAYQLAAASGDETYPHLSGHKLFTCALTRDGGSDRPGGDESTKEEKIAKAKAIALQRFVKWVRAKKLTQEELLAKAGVKSPKTRFEKAVAWAKSIATPSAAQAGTDDTAQNLYEIAATYSGGVEHTYTDRLEGLNWYINTYIVSVHSFSGPSNDGGEDVYYVSQECNFNGGFTHRRHWYEHSDYWSEVAKANSDNHQYWPNGAECDEFYCSAYSVNSKINASGSMTDFHCYTATPAANNESQTVTTQEGYSLGASATCGTMNEHLNAGVTLSAGYNSSREKSYTTTDISNSLNNQKTNITWNYTVNKVPARGETWHWNELTQPATLAISSYQPVGAFTWGIRTKDRTLYDSCQLMGSVNVQGAYSKNSGSMYPEYYTMTVSANGDIALPKPPLFCLDKETVAFDDSTTKDDTVLVYSQGTWEIVTAEFPSWLSVVKTTEKSTPYKGYLKISAIEANNTGAYRTAEIVIKRTDGTEAVDTRTITVTQSPNSK